MRHFITNITVTIITLLLISVASLWAFVRSEQLIITTEKDFENQRFIAATEPSEEEWMEIGEAVYTRNCAACHSADATGQSNYYPPLWNQVRVYQAENGEDYLIQTLLYGSATGLHSAPMPPLGNLSDVQVAAVLNFMLERFSEEESRFITTQDVEENRNLGLSEREVGRTRPDIPAPFELSNASR